METTNQPIETYLPIFLGFYGSRFEDPNFDGEAEHYNLPANFDFYKHFNSRAYEQALSKIFCDKVADAMSDFIDKVEFQELWSPKEYNFKNDSINCAITPNVRAISDYILQRREALSKYLEENLKSRSGFISFYNYSPDFWYERTEGFTKFDTEHLDLGFFLQFIAEQEELTEDIFDYCDTEIYVGEFFDTEFYKITDALERLDEEVVNVAELMDSSDLCDNLDMVAERYKHITAFIQENYRNIDMDILEAVKAKYSAEEGMGEYINFEALVKKVIDEIEGNNLKLEF
jgi:hypothetical protein